MNCLQSNMVLLLLFRWFSLFFRSISNVVSQLILFREKMRFFPSAPSLNGVYFYIYVIRRAIYVHCTTEQKISCQLTKQNYFYFCYLSSGLTHAELEYECKSKFRFNVSKHWNGNDGLLLSFSFISLHMLLQIGSQIIYWFNLIKRTWKTLY